MMYDSRIGEEAAIQFFLNKGWKVVDVSNNSNYWGRDIDLLAEKGDRNISIEVKWDSNIYRTGNMFIELQTDVLNNKNGWIFFTEADYIFYGDAQNLKFYVFKPEDMKEYLTKHSDEIRIITASDSKKGKISVGALVKPSNYNMFYTMSEELIPKKEFAF